MRIFTAVRHSADPRHYYGGLWSANFYPALRRLGHEIVESDTDLLPASRFMLVGGGFTAEEHRVRDRITEQVLAELKRAHNSQPIDLFLSYFYNAHFDPEGFAEIRKLGIPSVNFYCNSIYQFELVNAIAAAADFAWHAEKNAAVRYRSIGARPVWVQMAADPNVYRPVPIQSRLNAACFVGQRYADRDRWLAELTRAGVPLSIYGPGWKADQNPNDAAQDSQESTYLGRRQYRPGGPAAYLSVVEQNIRYEGLLRGFGRTARQLKYRVETRRLSPLFQPNARGAVPFNEICRVFSSHDVVLNFSNVWADGRPGSALIPHVRLRDFEAPMCGTCYITGHTDELKEFYELGTEVETYSTVEELVDKTRFYLSNSVAASRLRQAGYKRAVNDHTWERRFEQLFTGIGVA